MSLLKEGWGMLWVRDSPKETLEDTLERGIAYYKQKYNATPDYIECSQKDRDDLEFLYKDITVKSKKHYNSGVIWLTNKGE